MNRSLTVLATKLNQQLDDLNVHLHVAQNQIQALDQHIQHIEEQINQTEFNPSLINPKAEINRLSFLIKQQEKKEELSMAIKNYCHLENKLKEKIERVTLELKQLQNYLERHKEHE